MQVCMGYITVDNYDEIIANVDESQKVKIQNLCRSTITDWAYKNGMIIRRYQTGKYIVFFMNVSIRNSLNLNSLFWMISRMR